MSKKTLLFAFLIVALLLPATMVTAQDEVTITFRHHWGGNRIPIMEEQVAAFEAANPGIKVEIDYIGWDNRLPNLLTEIAAGEPPDVTMFGRQDLPFFAATESIVPLDDYMAADGITPDIFVPSEFLGNVYNGKVWMLPQPTGGALNIVWVNREFNAEGGYDADYFPETWEEMMEWGKAVTLDDDGFLERVGMNVMNTGGEQPAFLVWLNANGQDWLSEDLRTVTINNPAGVETLEFMQAYTDEVNFGIQEVLSFEEGYGEFDNLPLIQRVEVADINGSWTLFQIEEHAEDLDYGIAAVPYGPSGSPDRRGSTYGGWGYMIPMGSDNPDEAWQLVKWLTTEIEDTGACWFLQQQQRPSPLVDCDGYLRDGESHPRAEEILNVVALDSIAAISPVQPQAGEIIELMEAAVLYGDQDIETALADAEAEIQALLDEFWADYE
ncbi:extracellular solute-binding protein [Chloroflexota bacterium]